MGELHCKIFCLISKIQEAWWHIHSIVWAAVNFCKLTLTKYIIVQCPPYKKAKYIFNIASILKITLFLKHWLIKVKHICLWKETASLWYSQSDQTRLHFKCRKVIIYMSNASKLKLLFLLTTTVYLLTAADWNHGDMNCINVKATK